ncbi:CPBP family intramembrane glutamic endopeptidase [Clostridium ganghwense]|uniref:CPBP family intramembrane metalloprotease n=1 Tax=Clostridium ganghwense TaxID=312089 RepID=A0ABT4CUK7_9CLOT|nr:CPBP family intramembrane glutamic endopeptidase [Clostridium ganghwense]MCY6372737.1 CPBP family intramembrane metalloprotease [Clostridium ganghwense]
MKSNSKKVITFLILNFTVCSIFYYILCFKGSMYKNQNYVLGLMWVPAVTGMITQLIYNKNLKGFGWKFGKFKYLTFSYLIPLLSSLMVYTLVWITGMGGISIDNFTTRQGSGIFIQFIFFATVGLILSSISALGEEIGWRGFLVPELAKKYSYTKTSLITSAIWAIYHYPLIIFSNYNNGTSVWFSMIFFTISVTAVSFIAVWLRLKSGSLWTGVILHASHNLFIQLFFDVITIDYGKTKYITTEFGAGLALIYTIIGIYCWRNSYKLPSLKAYSKANTVQN